ncbi:putative quinol monooxygenase [Sandarakinorhabdus oryzae]|uniref:putative quinol monooxygenase n=1 Tax=Sandarakinorhabdus oryzae TaxID=2675220 RepID=UPI0018CC6D2B|nr:antibiotic biosynthesis monooxygenase [Sandarakinorhabdus oryzae]
MLIAHLRFPIAPEHRQIATDALLESAPAVRAMPGCMAFHPVHDPADPAMLGIVHEWQSEADFAAYTASDLFKAFGERIRPLMTGKPESRRFHAKLIEVVA